jgi:hypothetical protein
MFLSKISGGGTGSSGGNFKKKFKSFTRYINKTYGTDYAVPFVEMLMGGDDVLVRDDEILPSKTLDGVKVSSLSEMYLYFIEDENDIFVYGNVVGAGTNKWVSMSELLDVEFGGILTDIDREKMTRDVPYVFFYYVEAD